MLDYVKIKKKHEGNEEENSFGSNISKGISRKIGLLLCTVQSI